MEPTNKIDVLDFVRFAVSHAKKTGYSGEIYGNPGEDPWQYLYGTLGQKATEHIIEAKWLSYYSKHGWTREAYDKITQPWLDKETIVTDCNGLLDCFMHEDHNANQTFKTCTQRGLIAAISRPFIVGEAVFNGTDAVKSHIGWVCGFQKDGTPLVVEARGLKYGVVITSMAKREWKYRGLMTDRFDYALAPIQPGVVKFEFSRSLKSGMKGDDVCELKKLLITHGYAEGITVGSETFGAKTRMNVKNFQADAGLTIDGIAGRKTIRALGGIFR